MPRIPQRTRKFVKRYGKLGSKDRDDVDNALVQLLTFELYSGLSIEKLNKKPIQGYSILQARANDKIRICFILDEDFIGFIDVGSHDQIRRTDYSKWKLTFPD